MAKKFIILIFISLILIGGGVFWWKNREIKGKPEDYVIKDTAEGKIVENKRAGLTIRVPEGWLEKKMELLEGSVILYTPDVKQEQLNEMAPLEKGCIIETAVVYKKMNFDEIKEEIKRIHVGLGMKTEEFDVITINNRQVLKNTYDSVLLGPGMNICFSNNNKLYSLGINWASDDKEGCVQEFDKFLETVSIQ